MRSDKNEIKQKLGWKRKLMSKGRRFRDKKVVLGPIILERNRDGTIKMVIKFTERYLVRGALGRWVCRRNKYQSAEICLRAKKKKEVYSFQVEGNWWYFFL